MMPGAMPLAWDARDGFALRPQGYSHLADFVGDDHSGPDLMSATPATMIWLGHVAAAKGARDKVRVIAAVISRRAHAQMLVPDL